MQTPVLICGAGPIGLALAIDLAIHGIPCILVDDRADMQVGSRAVCWSKRSLEIFDRLGVGQRIVDKGVVWKVGRIYHRDRLLWSFDLLSETGHKRPAFVNLQQYYVERYLTERCRDFPDLIDFRPQSKLVDCTQTGSGVTARIETSDGEYELDSEWLIACDGVRSTMRKLMGLELHGQIFQEQFLISDFEMKSEFPPERWFWFEPEFHAGQSALLHRQPDNIYRLDFQLGPDADPVREVEPERVISRIRAMLGDREFRLEWVSIYTFRCCRLDRFVHDRVVFAGDSAHVVSPFGARGANGGLHDVDNLAWKLTAILEGRSPVSLLETYDEERIFGADENIRYSSQSTSFITPKNNFERLLRQETLALAGDYAFARPLVNGGRLSRPCSLAGMSLQTMGDTADGLVGPGMACADAPVMVAGQREGWLIDQLGNDFAVLGFGEEAFQDDELPETVCRLVVSDTEPTMSLPRMVWLRDADGLVAQRYGGIPGSSVLVRPDQHVAARFTKPHSGSALAAAYRRASGIS